MENTNFISTGFVSVDNLTGGFRPAELTIIAGHVASGHKWLMSSMASKIAANNTPVAVFSLGQSAELCSLMYFHSNSAGILEYDNIFIDDTQAPTISYFYDKCRKLKLENNIGIVFIDFVPLFRLEMSDKNMPDGLRNEIVTKALKAIARELKIAIVGMCIGGRGKEDLTLEHLEKKMPDVSSAADKILFVRRPSYCGIDTDENGNSTKDMLEIIAAKTPMSDGGKTMLKIKLVEYTRLYTEFEDITEKQN